MISLENGRFLTDSEFRRLREGCFEERMIRTHEAVMAAAADHFVEGSKLEVLATYEDKAIVFVDGECFEAKLDRTSGGEIRIVGVQPVTVETFDEDSLPQYVQRQAQEAVDLFLRGSSQAAVERILAAVPYINTQTAKPSAALESVEVQLKAPTKWQQTLRERSSEVKKLIRNHFGEDALGVPKAAKFIPLHECTDQEKLNGYKSLVHDDTQILVQQINALWEDASESQNIARSALRDEAIEDGGILSVFSDFVAGLVESLRTLGESATSAAAAVSGNVAVQSKLHDMLIEGLRPYEVGTRFAVAVAQRLDEAK
jgi:hypothetical protein